MGLLVEIQARTVLFLPVECEPRCESGVLAYLSIKPTSRKEVEKGRLVSVVVTGASKSRHVSSQSVPGLFRL